jgi:hypothetical protein
MVRQIAEVGYGREKVFNVSMKESLDIVTKDKKRKDILLAPKAGKAARKDMKQICIHGIARQTCFACVGGGGSPNKPHAKGGVHYGK